MSSQASSKQQESPPTVVVTGFGLFRDHKLNTSWEAIRDGRLSLDRRVRLVTREIAVSYDEVDRVVANLWQEYQPVLMVHIGLSALESCIKVEQIARHGPYINDDVAKCAPHKDLRLYGGEHESSAEKSIQKGFLCKPCSFDMSKTCIDVDRVCSKLMSMFDEGTVKFKTLKSQDAGLYLCEYIYFKSLCHSDRAVFVHVPDMEKYPLEDIRNNLKHLIEVLIDEVLIEQQL